MDAKKSTLETIRQMDGDDLARLREDFYQAADAINALEETAADLKLNADHAVIVEIRRAAFHAKLNYLARIL